MAVHFSNLVREIPWTEDSGGCSPRCLKELDMAEHTHTFIVYNVLELVLKIHPQCYMLLSGIFNGYIIFIV